MDVRNYLKVGAISCLLSFSAMSSAAEADATEEAPTLSRTNAEYALTVEQGLLSLHAQNYEKSFRLLTEGAQFGNKQSQFYLAMSYFNGWGTEIDNKQGWLWLNVAMEAKNTRWNHSFKKIADAIPDEIEEAWEADVQQHIARFGADATEHHCHRYRPTGSSIMEIICEREYDGS